MKSVVSNDKIKDAEEDQSPCLYTNRHRYGSEVWLIDGNKYGVRLFCKDYPIRVGTFWQFTALIDYVPFEGSVTLSND